MDKVGRQLQLTSAGRLLVVFLKAYYAQYVELGFTSSMEAWLDTVAGAVLQLRLELHAHLLLSCCLWACCSAAARVTELAVRVLRKTVALLAGCSSRRCDESCVQRGRAAGWRGCRISGSPCAR